jgi:hypothetical protein
MITVAQTINEIVMTTPSSPPANATETVSRKALWTGRVLSGLVIAFLLMDALMKVAQASVVLDSARQLGYPPETMFGIGLTLLISTLLYVIPQTSVLGAILLTGYLGGAVATHVRIGNPMFTHTLFPIYLGVLLWGGLVLRNRRVRNLFSVTR